MPPNGNYIDNYTSSSNSGGGGSSITHGLLDSFIFMTGGGSAAAAAAAAATNPGMMDLSVLKELQQRHHAAAQALANMQQLHEEALEKRQREQQQQQQIQFEIRVIKEENHEEEEATDLSMAGTSKDNGKQQQQHRRHRSSPAFLDCHVCGDRAPNHVHYGGIACFSCRAFFRRSVPKYKGYFCMADAACEITPSTRKNCQFCRYQKCLSTGMKASWVLSDKEKVERMAKKRENRARRAAAAAAASGNATVPTLSVPQESISCSVSSVGSTPSSPSSTPPLMMTIPTPLSSPAAVPTTEVKQPGPAKPSKDMRLSPDQLYQIDEWVKALEQTRQTVLMPSNVMGEIFRLTTATEDVPMSSDGVVGLFRTVYSRVAEFAGATAPFSRLTGEDRKKLLARNLDSAASARLATCLEASTGRGNLVAQLTHAGRSAGSVSDCQLGPRAIQVEQVFVAPWARSDEHASAFGAAIRRLAALYGGDCGRTAALMQLVCLFNSADIPYLEERSAIEQAQSEAAHMLHAHLCSKSGRAEGSKTFAALTMMLSELRRLADILRTEEESNEEN